MEISFKSVESKKFKSYIYIQSYYKFYIDQTFILKSYNQYGKIIIFHEEYLIYFLFYSYYFEIFIF